MPPVPLAATRIEPFHISVGITPTWGLAAWTLAGLILLVALTRLLNRWLVKPGETPEETLKANRGCLTLLAALAIVTLFSVTVRPVYRSIAADRWPTTGGTVLNSQLGKMAGGKGGFVYRVDIHYRYVVDGVAYESSQYGASGGWYSAWRERKQAAVDAHPTGSAVTVHYNPSDPANAMLSTAFPDGTVVLIGFLAAAVSVVGAVLFYRRRRERQRHGSGRVASAEPDPR